MSRGFELERLPLLRTVFTPEAVRERDVVVSGVPAEWTSTAKSIRRAGGRWSVFTPCTPVADEHDGLPVYEHPSVSARPGDVVLDVGAYDGDTARRYSARVGAEGRVVALEPSHQNYIKLCENTARQKLDNVLPLCLGAADKHEVASFREGKEAASALAVDGDLKVPLTTLDRLAALLALSRVDIIKLDVEGVERQVLAGAWDVVERYRPMLQVSIYYMPKDLFQLPLLLMRRLRDYTYFVGHHSFYHVETDLYCCPRERLI